MIDMEELREMIDEALDEVNPAYLKGSPQKTKRAEEIKKRAKKPSDDPKSYRPFATDKDPKTGEQIKTKPSKWTSKAAKMGYGPSNEGSEREEGFLIECVDLAVLREFICEAILDEKKGGNVTAALKNKAEKSGAPMSALRAIYNKGLAAWRTGHRPGASQHQWAMARVNSVLAGGPARKVDAAQWEKIKKARGKKKKKK
jgi:hypothetical protein